MAAQNEAPDHFEAAYKAGVIEEQPPAGGGAGGRGCSGPRPGRTARAPRRRPHARRGDRGWLRRDRRNRDRGGPKDAARGRPRPGQQGRDRPRPDRPPWPPRVQHLRRLGAAEAVHQPLRLARERPLPAAGPRPPEPPARGPPAEDPASLRRDPRPHRRGDRDPGHRRPRERLPGRGAGSKRRQVDLRLPGRTVADRPPDPGQRVRDGLASEHPRGDREQTRSRPSTSTSPRDAPTTSSPETNSASWSR